MNDLYVDPGELADLRAQIERSGFEPDPLVAENVDRAHLGVNITVGWPMPAAMEAAHLEFEKRVLEIAPRVYVYPFSTTHITVLTAVSFKKYPDPRPETVGAVEDAAERLGDWLAGAVNDLAPFTLAVGRPVLARAAAFIRFRNPTGEIARVRERALAFCRQSGGLLSAASAPDVIHTTVLRFPEAPSDPIAFTRSFDAIASQFDAGEVPIDRFLVTLETKPYMRAGRATRTIVLRP